MSADDKISAKADVLAGKGKEAVGDAVGNERLQAEGQGDQAKGHAREAVEKVKDVAKDIFGHHDEH